MMEISVIDDDSGATAAFFELARTSITAALAREQIDKRWNVAVMFASEDTMRTLNRRFNGDDEITDVLAFNQSDAWTRGKPSPARDKDDRAAPESDYLGDIAICFEQVRRQARAAGVAVEYELAKMAVHGALHLIGYDHYAEDERREMFSKTDRILASVLQGVK